MAAWTSTAPRRAGAARRGDHGHRDPVPGVGEGCERMDLLWSPADVPRFFAANKRFGEAVVRHCRGAAMPSPPSCLVAGMFGASASGGLRRRVALTSGGHGCCVDHKPCCVDKWGPSTPCTMHASATPMSSTVHAAF
ncbi:hypothetical protein ACP4OV_017578 [Aristida adscensionis]